MNIREINSPIPIFSSNNGNENFVGIRYIPRDNVLDICFPLGFRLSSEIDKDGRKKDVNLLIKVLRDFCEDLKGEKVKSDYVLPTENENFPINSYIYLLDDFFSKGGEYYREKNIQFKEDSRGRINWSKTIKKIIPYFQNKNNLIFTDFVVKKNSFYEDGLITKIHEYCIYEAMSYIGFLYSNFSFNQKTPEISFNKALFLNEINRKLSTSFNDKNKMLFLAMKNIVELKNENSNVIPSFGTYNFEIVWEKMIDSLFGVKDKKKYFPRSYWNIIGDKDEHNFCSLRPDSIMLLDCSGKKNCYILDAKYYRYGVTGKKEHLPGSSSIAKQITYAEYIVNNITKFEKLEETSIWNAFLMPFNKEEYPKNKNKNSAQNQTYFNNIGFASMDEKITNEEGADKKDTEIKYKQIHGILVDTKWLMENYKNSENKEFKEELAESIEK